MRGFHHAQVWAVLLGVVVLAARVGSASAVALEAGSLVTFEPLSFGLCRHTLSLCQAPSPASRAGVARMAYVQSGRAHLDAQAVGSSLPLPLESATPLASVGIADRSAANEVKPRSISLAMLALIGLVAVARRTATPRL